MTPLPKTDTEHVLLQGSSGEGALLMIDRDGAFLGGCDMYNGSIASLGQDLRRIKKGWHFCCATYDYRNSNALALYLDGAAINKSMSVRLEDNVRYVGNSRDGTKPFGVMCDLRIYNHIIPKSQIDDMRGYNEDDEFEFPDRLIMSFVAKGVIPPLLA